MPSTIPAWAVLMVQFPVDQAGFDVFILAGTPRGDNSVYPLYSRSGFISQKPRMVGIFQCKCLESFLY